MILRPRQTEFRDCCVHKLKSNGNTIGVAPTGAGKTVIMSSVIGALNPKSGLVLQHRDELVEQNRATFRKVNPSTRTDVFNADRKSFLTDGVTFAMVQTLCRNLDLMRPVDVLAIDECHHVAADSYQRIVLRAKELNPRTMMFGVSATPERADKASLKTVFSNIADVITVKELILSGNLVRPRTMVIDCGLRDQLKGVRKTAQDFDMDEVAAIMDNRPVTNRVVEEWKKNADGRRTILFASTVSHAEHVKDAFLAAGVAAELVHGKMNDTDRRAALKRLESGQTTVVCNVAVLTEGFDCPPVSCVVLLRPCSHKSTMIQMIGRGLRKIDPERYPGLIKDNCVVLDFGYSIITHGNIDADTDIDPQKKPGTGEAPSKNCPECGFDVPAACSVCPQCGYVFVADNELGGLEEFKMTEIDILDISPFRWEPLFDGQITVANGITAWAAIVGYRNRWIAVGAGDTDRSALILANSDDKCVALSSADDFLRDHGDSSTAKKSRSWLSLPPSPKQAQLLGLGSFSPVSRYRASCMLTFKFCERMIKSACQRALTGH